MNILPQDLDVAHFRSLWLPCGCRNLRAIADYTVVSTPPPPLLTHPPYSPPCQAARSLIDCYERLFTIFVRSEGSFAGIAANLYDSAEYWGCIKRKFRKHAAANGPLAGTMERLVAGNEKRPKDKAAIACALEA